MTQYKSRPSMNVARGRSRRRRKRRIRHRRRRINWKWILLIFGILLILSGIGYLETIVFQTKQIEVTGTVYTRPQDVEKWIRRGKYSDNSLYVLWKYNQKDIKQLPSVEGVAVSLKSPRKILVNVTEKTFSGRIDYDGKSLYFDKDGIASLQSEEVIEGITYIEGMEIDEKKVKIGSKIPAIDEKIFDKISQLSAVLKKNKLTADKISCSGENLVVTFGNVRVAFGSDGFEEKIKQVLPILEKLAEQYADQSGVLHLENYKSSDAAIRFVPDTQE